MPRIRTLSPEVVGRIAAGEVIERPASVLKELLENSLDAGASKIQVESLGAGRKMLRVADDGAGMEPADCRLALERHATSKISSIDDLDRLSTFGFRGEALFSIAAVSRITLTSCAAGSSKGWQIESDGGKIKAEHEAPAVPGTILAIRDLFFNTPARAKFLKSDPSEKGHLMHTIEEAAMANPAVTFLYKSENRTALHLKAVDSDDPVQASLRRITDILGNEWSEGLLPASEKRGDFKLLAFLAPPDKLSATRNLQFCFINRRPVVSRLVQQALYRAYEPFRSRDRHPVAVLMLELPPDRFDVNVHPAKREVRFRDERELFELLTGTFSTTLLNAKGIPTVDVSLPSRTGGLWNRQTFPSPAISLVRESVPYPPQETPAKPKASWPRWFTPPFAYLGQIEKSYLVFDAAGGLLVVDQHAAQERILFERYLAEMEAGCVRSQRLMLPLPIELPSSRIQHLLNRRESLRRAGFETEPFGKTTLHVTAAPATFTSASDLKDIFHRLLDSLESEGEAIKDIKRHAVATIACKAAVKAHDRLGPQEALRLLEELKDCKDGTCCPHGRPSMISLNRDELARRFKRPGAPLL